MISTSGLRGWLLEGLSTQSNQLPGPHQQATQHHQHPWWKVMCLTGVDYFSTLGYQPGFEKEHEERLRHQIPPDDPVLFLEVTVADPSEFEARLQVTGEERHGYRILRIESSAVPNAIAAVLLHIRDLTGKRPHIYFDWTEGNPVAHLVRFLIFGSGEVAPVTREVLRTAEPNLEQRPFVHVV